MAALPENTSAATPAAMAGAQKPLIDLILDTLDDAKAEETVSVDIAGKSSLADHMIVTSGRSQRHVGAVARKILAHLAVFAQHMLHPEIGQQHDGQQNQH